MKIGWVVVIAVLALAGGLFGGTLLGTAGGAMGGGLAGVCHTAQVAASEGLITDEQRRQLFAALAGKHAETARALQLSGDLNTACKDLLQNAR